MKTHVNNKALVAETALFFAAFFWGLSFVFQREAMAFMTPFAFLGMRFTMGALLLLPFAWRRLKSQMALSPDPRKIFRDSLLGGLVAGTLVFVASALQQYGILWTTVAKTGFITSLYVVLVPVLMILFGRRVRFGEGLGAVLALVGLFLLSFTESLSLSLGDTLVLIGAFVWAAHVICLGWISPRMDSFVLGTGQSLFCGLWGLAFMFGRGEMPALDMLWAGAPSLIGGGLFSVAIGFTLQIFGQRDASPSAAAIILQLEAVFAAIFGWLLLGESMTGRMLLGAVVMLLGVLASQLWPETPVATDAAVRKKSGCRLNE